MRIEEFREWLKARRWNGKPISTVGLRISRAKRFEQAMPALGLGEADLDASFERDGLESVTTYLRNACRTAAQTNEAPSELVGDTTIPVQRINSLTAAVRNYRQFREEDSAVSSAWPELEELRAAFLDRVPEFERFDHTDNEYERVERTYKDAMIGQLQAIAASDDGDEAAGRRIFRALIPNEGPLLRWQTDDDFARKFPALAPAFYTAIGRLARDTGSTVDAIMAAADAFAQLRAQGATTLTMGEIVSVAFSVAGMARPDQAVPFKISKAQALGKLLTGDPIFIGSVLQRDQVERWLDLLRRIETVMRDEWHWHPRDLIDVQGFAWVALDEKWKVEDEMSEDEGAETIPIWMVTARNGAADGLSHFVENDEWHLLEDRGGRANALVREMQTGDRIVLRDYFGQKHGLPFETHGSRVTALRIRATGVVTEQRNDGTSVGVDWTVLPEPKIWYFYTNNDPVWRLRTDEEEMARMLAAFIFDNVPQDYDWFVARWFDEPGATASKATMPDPTNLILYGPPGTGKTYATAAHAVRLCDGLMEDDPLLGPDRRAALMARYAELATDERIEFVTFHQSMAYEEFVEGLRPSSVDKDGRPLAAGFQLLPRPGIFHRIAERADTLRTRAPDDGYDLGTRQVFKMSLGEAANPDDDYLYDEAMAGGYVLLGDDSGVDWTATGLETKAAMIDAFAARYPDRPRLSPLSGYIEFAHTLRSRVKTGDLVIVSKGNLLFRAIGEVTGEFETAERENGDDYRWRRTVRWLWRDDDGKPYDLINAKRFSQRTIYELSRRELKADAIESLLAAGTGGDAGPAQPFVLVIDEINRANISKVFGELITLLEADKRIGAANELRVRLTYSGDSFGVPANLHIVGTMNTADRSIALLDTALRRRFTFAELMPDPDVLAPVDGIDLPALLRSLNDRIEYLFDREHQIGHAYFLPCKTRDDVNDVMRHKVIPLLAEYFYEDWTKVAAVLGDVFPDDGRDHDGSFLSRRALRSPFPSGEGEEAYRYRWTVRDAGDFSYAKAVAAA